MTLLQIINIILPIILLAGIGFVFGQFRKINLKKIADFTINITTPALAFSLMLKTTIGVAEIGKIALAATIIIVGIAFACRKLKLPLGLYLPAMFMNSGNIGFPLCLFSFGHDGLSKAIIFNTTNAILIFTLGIFIISQGKDKWQVFKVPFVYGALLGLLFSLLNIRLPETIYFPIYLLGQITIPLSLFILGYRLSTTKIKSLALPAQASALRIIGGLLLGISASWILGLSGMTAKVVILLSSLPAAIMAIALAEKYETDSSLVASTIVLSTIASLITIPIILVWLL